MSRPNIPRAPSRRHRAKPRHKGRWGRSRSQWMGRREGEIRSRAARLGGSERERVRHPSSKGGEAVHRQAAAGQGQASIHLCGSNGHAAAVAPAPSLRRARLKRGTARREEGGGKKGQAGGAAHHCLSQRSAAQHHVPPLRVQGAAGEGLRELLEGGRQEAPQPRHHVAEGEEAGGLQWIAAQAEELPREKKMSGFRGGE